jgi:hypothetical protein
MTMWRRRCDRCEQHIGGDGHYNLVRKVIEQMEQAGCWLCERDTSEEDTANYGQRAHVCKHARGPRALCSLPLYLSCVCVCVCVCGVCVCDATHCSTLLATFSSDCVTLSHTSSFSSCGGVCAHVHAHAVQYTRHGRIEVHAADLFLQVMPPLHTLTHPSVPIDPHCSSSHTSQNTRQMSKWIVWADSYHTHRNTTHSTPHPANPHHHPRSWMATRDRQWQGVVRVGVRGYVVLPRGHNGTARQHSRVWPTAMQQTYTQLTPRTCARSQQ